MTELKQQLTEIKKNDYTFAGYDLDKLISEMLRDIGSTDSELRDELIYITFGKMIMTHHVLNKDQLTQLLFSCVDDEHLFYRLGETETDSVFVRSFSVLIIPLILSVDQHDCFLSESEIQYIRKRLFTYVRNEKDIRGFVDGKGWAHSVAHAADALGAMAQHRYIKEEGLLELLDVLTAKILIPGSVYTHNEDERMAFSAFTTIDRGVLSEQQLSNWLHDLQSQMNAQKKMVSDPESLYLKLNVRNFLYNLQFRLRSNHVGSTLQKEVEQVLDSIRDF